MPTTAVQGTVMRLGGSRKVHFNSCGLLLGILNEELSTFSKGTCVGRRLERTNLRNSMDVRPGRYWHRHAPRVRREERIFQGWKAFQESYSGGRLAHCPEQGTRIEAKALLPPTHFVHT